MNFCKVRIQTDDRFTIPYWTELYETIKKEYDCESFCLYAENLCDRSRRYDDMVIRDDICIECHEHTHL
jgi:hypothetical protein